jgi:hypothetical protein
VRKRPLLGACGAAALCIAAALALLPGHGVPSTWALFNAETENASSGFAGGWLAAPTFNTATVSTNSNSAALAWAVSTHGPGSGSGQGQLILGTPTATNGTGTSCPTTGYTTVNTPAATATSATLATAGQGYGGEKYCFEIASTYATNWSTVSASKLVTFSFFTTGLSVANGGTSNKIASGDSITLTFNNAPTVLSSSGSLSLVACTSTRVYIGTTSCGSPSVGWLTATNRTFTGTTTLSSSYTFSSSTDTLQIALSGSNSVTLTGSSTPSWKFTPASLKQAGNVTICTTGTACLPTTSNNF